MLPFLVERVGIIRHLAYELSQPIDPKASEIDYLPTQYLAEVILNQGYDGVLFNSAMSDGQNLVLFDPQKASGSTSFLITVTNVHYSVKRGSG